MASYSRPPAAAVLQLRPDAEMGECLLQGALLEDCVLAGASLRFADLRSAALERRICTVLICGGARLDSVQAAGAAFGDQDAARWAYGKRRRMEKTHHMPMPCKPYV